jgi:hypothetical protein
VSTSDEDQDKRGAVRHEYVNFAWFKRVDDSALEADEGVARSCDVSGHGVGMITTRALPAGSRLFIELIGRAGRVSAIGTVVHCADAPNGCYRIGIRIDSLPPTDQLTWKDMVQK